MSEFNTGSARETGSATSDGSQAAAARFDSLVCFAIAEKTFALDVALVREVVTVEKLLPVPRAPAPIIGAFALRGATLALVDARILFGLDSGTKPGMALILARAHRTLCALTIDRVIGVFPFNEANFTPAVRGREPPEVAGFLPDDHGGLLTILDTPTIVRSIERLKF
jgi:chemotaxis signal transduction protein